ncbi:RNA-guided pseudouridylation complex pseudouridine synthase subunit Cbf5 [archaeon]|nr:RNA-guided pseudouridylation complex pseudouridine synthase subunit Cbf5 [archaeon]
MNQRIEKIKRMKSTKELIDFGIINIDKCSGPTSFQVSEFVKKKLGLSKSSHFGTLDPKVTGVLPVALGRACKLAGYFLGEDKTYIGIMHLHEPIELEKINKAIKEKFTGDIIQMPPVKSRVKRENRTRKIYEFEILEYENQDALFRVKCEGGTYVRKLCTDLGDELGCGAHMLELRRTNAGIFSEHNTNYPVVNLYEFEKAIDEYKLGNETRLRNMLIPAEVISELHPFVEIKNEVLKKVLHGSPIHKEDLIGKLPDFKKEKIFLAFSKDNFVGVFKVVNEGDIFARSEFTLQPIK